MKSNMQTVGIAITTAFTAILLTGCGFALTRTASGEEASNIFHPKDAAEFQSMTTNGLVLIDFYADWCGPCRMLAPVLNEVADTSGNSLKIVKVNVDNHRDLAQQFRVQGIPYLVLMNDGNIKTVSAGYQNKSQLTEWIKKNSGSQGTTK